MAQTQPFFVYFRPFLNSKTNVVQYVDYKWKKRRWCAWDSNLGSNSLCYSGLLKIIGPCFQIIMVVPLIFNYGPTL